MLNKRNLSMIVLFLKEEAKRLEKDGFVILDPTSGHSDLSDHLKDAGHLVFTDPKGKQLERINYWQRYDIDWLICVVDNAELIASRLLNKYPKLIRGILIFSLTPVLDLNVIKKLDTNQKGKANWYIHRLPEPEFIPAFKEIDDYDDLN